MVSTKQFFADKKLYTECESMFATIFHRMLPNRIFMLQDEEIKDIRSEAIIRVFQKRHLYKKNKGKLTSYAATIICNSIKNSLRNRFGDRRNKKSNRNAKIQANYPLHLITKIEQINIYGEEAIVIEPDMIDEKNDFSKMEKDEFFNRQKEIFLSQIDPDGKKIIRLLQEGKSGIAIAKILKKRRGWVYSRFFNLKKMQKQSIPQY